MKRFFAVLLFALTFCLSSNAQTLTGGSVMQAACITNPDGTSTAELFIGGGVPEGGGGFLGNGFGYANGKLTAFYQPPAAFGRPAFSLTATIGTTVYLPPIDSDFGEIAFTLTNIQLAGCGPVTTFKQGRYYQGIYGEGSVHGDAPGGIVLEQ